MLQVVMAVFAYLYFNNVVARQTVTVGYMLQKSLQLDGDHMLELFTKLGAPCLLPNQVADTPTKLMPEMAWPLISSTAS